MNKLIATAATVSALLFATQANAANLTLQEYKPDQNAVFPVTSVLASGEKDAILFDAQFSVSDGKALVDMIKKSNKDLKMIYITAGDPDYYFGLQPLIKAFPSVKVVSSPSIVKHIEATKEAKLAHWGPILGKHAPTKITVPQVLNQSTLTLEGHEIDIKEINTPQAYMWVPESKTVFGGVSVTSGMHVWTADTQTTEARSAWVESLERMKLLNPNIVIPGHYMGTPLQQDYAVDFTISYLKTFEQALAATKNQDGKQSEKVIDIMTSAYSALPGESDLELSSQVNTGEMEW